MTRADFYVGGKGGKPMQWIGSVNSDGYPVHGSVDHKGSIGTPHYVLKARTLKAYRKAVERYLKSRGEEAKIGGRWPWSWPTSERTDYVYTFGKGRVWIYSQEVWVRAKDYTAPDREPEFPDMSGA